MCSIFKGLTHSILVDERASLECATFICFGRQFCEVERNKARLCHSHVRVKDRPFADMRFEDHNLSNWTILSTGEDPKTGVIHVKLPE